MKFLVYIRLMTNLRRVIKTYYIILALNLKGKKNLYFLPEIEVHSRVQHRCLARYNGRSHEGEDDGGTGKNLISKSPKINCARRLIVLWPCASKRYREPAASIYTGNVIFTTAYIRASSQSGHPFRPPQPAFLTCSIGFAMPWCSVPGFTVLHAVYMLVYSKTSWMFGFYLFLKIFK